MSVLREARQVYAAVESREGPHVTPGLYAWSDGRVWFPAATSTLKARVIDDGTPVAAAVIGRGSAVLIDGIAEIFDPRRARTLLRPGSVPRVARAITSFGLRNAGDLLGFARDTVTGNSVSRIPQARLLVAVRPERMMFIENDRVTWQSDPDGTASEQQPDVPAGGVPAVVAFVGPRVAPARWFGGDRRLFVAPEVLSRHGVAGRVPIAIVVDAYNAPGPAAKQGALIRGEGDIGHDGWVSVAERSTVSWNGADMTRTGRGRQAGN